MVTDDRSPHRATDEQFTEQWRAHRPVLVNLAYGMLADIGRAEDAVQEAFTRFAGADYAALEDVRAWLIVVTTRICLDQINSAPSRRERAFETATVEFAGEPAIPAPVGDPADRLTLDDEVRSAMFVVLQRLSPAERVVFVLHDVFGTPFDSIAETVGKPAATCRQLARRARMKVREEQTRVSAPVDLQRHRIVADRFIHAAATGDIQALLPLLDPDVWGDADLGPLDRRTGVINRGPKIVSRNLMRWFGPQTTLVCNPLGDHCEILAFLDRKLYSVIQLNVTDDVIKSLHVIADPAQLGAIEAQTQSAGVTLSNGVAP